jgi:hypothetical protein
LTAELFLSLTASYSYTPKLSVKKKSTNKIERTKVCCECHINGKVFLITESFGKPDAEQAAAAAAAAATTTTTRLLIHSEFC